MKIGIDIHGTADAFPEFFKELSKLFVKAGHEVHIVTGVAMDKALEDLAELGMSYTHVFSVVSHHKKIGTAIEYKDNGPWMDDDTWNRSKAEYAKNVGLDIMIDDSEKNGTLFETPYMKVAPPPAYTFTATTIQDVITASSLVGEKGNAVISGEQLKLMAEGFNAVKDDIGACHRLCTKMGVPEGGDGTASLRKRLQYLFNGGMIFGGKNDD